MTEWQVTTLTPEATKEVASLLQEEDIREELRRILKILADQEDPRSPTTASGIRVGEVVDDAPGWFVLYVPRFGIRIIFRLVIVRGERMIEIMAYQAVPDEADQRVIDIMQAVFRRDAYGEELRRRYRKYRGGKS
jgi:hypothetical protein